MLAFHNSPGIKNIYLERVRAHRVAYEIRQNYGYWQEGNGCAVGCTIHGDDHADYETELGIPQVLAKLEDRIFEGLPNHKAKEWPELFLSAIRPGADLTQVCPQFLAWLLADPSEGVIRLVNSEATREAIRRVATLYDGGCTDVTEWRAAEEAALDSANEAGYAAADASYEAARAAYYAAYAAADASAAYAAGSAASEAAYEAARAAAFVRQSEKLLELLRAA